MANRWREWRRGTHAGVSDRDSDSDVAVWALLLCGVGFALAISLAWWLLAAVFVIAAAGVVTGSRFRLTIGPNGYRLTRLFLWVVPWYCRKYSAEAIITTEDDWGNNIGLIIHEATETCDHGMTFGTSRDCKMLAQRLRTLAFEIGCRDRTVDTPSAAESITPRRRRRFF